MLEFSQKMIETLSGGLGVWYPVLYNAIGMISIVIQILIYQMKTRKAIIFVSMANHVGWFSYFALQGDFLSGVSNVVGLVSGPAVPEEDALQTYSLQTYRILTRLRCRQFCFSGY